MRQGPRFRRSARALRAGRRLRSQTLPDRRIAVPAGRVPNRVRRRPFGDRSAQGWEQRLVRGALVTFQERPDANLPRIVVTVSPSLKGFADVDEQNVAAFTERVAAAFRGTRLPYPVKPVILGDVACAARGSRTARNHSRRPPRAEDGRRRADVYDSPMCPTRTSANTGTPPTPWRRA